MLSIIPALLVETSPEPVEQGHLRLQDSRDGTIGWETTISSYWVLQGDPTLWDRPETLFTEPITGWSVTGAQDDIAVDDGVLLWIANRKAEERGIHAVGRVSGAPRQGYPYGWGTSRQRSRPTWFVTLSTYWYVVHNPVNVLELRTSPFAGHQILKMPRRTAYSCTEEEFFTALDLVRTHGPTAIPVSPAAEFDEWWGLT
jgi:hypothetical protein